MSIEILKTPVVQYKKDTVFKTNDKILRDLINNYIKILEENLSKENLKLFRNNISTLKIEYKNIIYGLISNIFKNDTSALYYLDENKISVLPLNKKYLGYNISYNTEDFIEDLYHELLHMSSTIIDKEKNIAFSGFSQIGNSIPIGVSLDDGYTELLLYRLLDMNKEHMTYKYEIIIATLIEDIVEKNIMINLYFNANLYGLILELQNYNTKENIINFLENIDSVYVLENHSSIYKKDIIYYHNKITKFIVDTYLNKLKKDLERGIITTIEYDIKLDKCINDLHSAFEILNIEKSKIRKK